MLISHQPRANRHGMGIAVRFDHNRGVLFAIGNLKSEQREISKLEESVLPVDLAVRVCDNVNMKPRIAAICAIVAFATCGGRAPAQFPRYAYLSVTDPCPFSVDPQAECQPSIDPQEACQDCPPGTQVFYVENFRKDGPVTVTIRVELWDVVHGN